MLMTLSEIRNTCDDWSEFCEKYRWAEWTVSEGGGHIEQELSVDEAKELGIIKYKNSVCKKMPSDLEGYCWW